MIAPSGGCNAPRKVGRRLAKAGRSFTRFSGRLARSPFLLRSSTTACKTKATFSHEATFLQGRKSARLLQGVVSFHTLAASVSSLFCFSFLFSFIFFFTFRFSYEGAHSRRQYDVNVQQGLVFTGLHAEYSSGRCLERNRRSLEYTVH